MHKVMCREVAVVLAAVVHGCARAAVLLVDDDVVEVEGEVHVDVDEAADSGDDEEHGDEQGEAAVAGEGWDLLDGMLDVEGLTGAVVACGVEDELGLVAVVSALHLGSMVVIYYKESRRVGVKTRRGLLKNVNLSKLARGYQEMLFRALVG